MRFLKVEKSLEDLEVDRDKSRIKAETASYQAQEAERLAVIKQLKREYGGGWRQILGINKMTDLSTLKSFLSGAKKGMTKATVVTPTVKDNLWGNQR